MRRLTKETMDATTLQQAMAELGIDVPVRAWAVARGRLVLHLATGQVVRWAPKKMAERRDNDHVG